MIPKLQTARLKCIDSLGPMPHHSHFKLREQVLVRFKSGWFTLGQVMQLNNGYRVGPRTVKYVYFRDMMYSHCRPLGGQLCTCFETGRAKRKGKCPVCDSGFVPPKPMVVTVQAVATAVGGGGLPPPWIAGSPAMTAPPSAKPPRRPRRTPHWTYPPPQGTGPGTTKATP